MLLSEVTRTSKPAFSTAVRKSPFFNLAQPRSRASVTVWPESAPTMPRGTLLSSRISKPLRTRRHIKAVSGEVQYGFYLLPGNWVLFDNFIDSHAVFQVLENELNGRPRVSKGPGATNLAGDAFHGGASRPIEICHFLT